MAKKIQVETGYDRTQRGCAQAGCLILAALVLIPMLLLLIYSSGDKVLDFFK